jgi:uncharacterized protein YidB (DUF937 family)
MAMFRYLNPRCLASQLRRRLSNARLYLKRHGLPFVQKPGLGSAEMVVTFDNLVDDIDARYCLGPKAAPFIQETSRLVTKHPGGIGGVVRRFRDAGFAVEVASWLGGSDPVPLSGQEVEQTLGSEVVSGIANKIGVSQRFAGTILGYAIPSIIVLMAQGGAVPSALRASVLRIFGLAIPRFPSRPEEITKHTTQQIRPSITEGSGATPAVQE